MPYKYVILQEPGRERKTSYPDKLQFVHVTLWNNTQCRKAFEVYPVIEFSLTEAEICAKDEVTFHFS